MNFHAFHESEVAAFANGMLPRKKSLLDSSWFSLMFIDFVGFHVKSWFSMDFRVGGCSLFEWDAAREKNFAGFQLVAISTISSDFMDFHKI